MPIKCVKNMDEPFYSETDFATSIFTFAFNLVSTTFVLLEKTIHGGDAGPYLDIA